MTSSRACGIRSSKKSRNLRDIRSVLQGVRGEHSVLASVGRNIAYTYLPPSRAKPGLPLQVDVFGERVAGEVAPDILVDPKGTKLTA